MRSLLIVALLVSASAFAGEVVSKKVSFSIMSSTGGEVNYYNCNYVEEVVEAHLKTLGAQNARANCNGGLEMGQGMPASVTVKFDAPVSTGGAVEAKTIKGRTNDNCHLNTQILNKLIPQLPAVTLVSKTPYCFNSNSRWSYNVTIAQ